MPPYALDKSEIRRLIEAEARRQGLNPALVEAVIRQESNFDPQARSSAGAIGLMQLMPATARGLGVNPYDVQDNIRGGVRYLKQQQQTFGGDTAKALAAYNAGPEAVKKYGGVPPYKETQGYVRRIMGFLSPKGAEAATGGMLPDLPARPAPQRAPQTEASSLLALPDLPDRPGAAAGVAPPPETFPPLAEQEAAATRQALYGRRPPGADASSGQTSPLPAPAPAVPPAPTTPAPTAQTQGELLRQQEAGRLQAERDVGSLTVPAPTATDVAKAAAATGISLAGSAGGAALGGLVGSVVPGPGTAIGTVAGEMAGSYAARKVNVALGLEEPGTLGDVTAVVMPGVGRAAAPVTKAIVRRLPGAQAAMHTELGERLGRQIEGLAPATPSHALYEQVAQGANPQISTVRLWRTAHDLLREEQRLQPAMRNPHLMRVAQDVIDMGRQGLGQVEMRQLYANQQRVGEMLRSARRAGGTEERGLRRLYGAFHDDLERAAHSGIPEADTLRMAIATSRREHAVDELEDLFRPGRPGIVQRADGQLSISGGKLQSRFEDRLRTDRVFAGSFQPGEVEAIRGILRESTRLKAVPPGRGVQFGSGPTLARGTLAAGVTQAVTGDPALATLVGTVVAGAPHVLSWGLSSAPGRAIVRQALREGHRLEDPVTLMSLVLAMRPAAAEALAPGE